MNRHYDTAEYARIVRVIRQNFENPAITTDIMVGFPGETEEDFAESVAFAREIAFAKVHVFPYSPRPGTPAANRPDQVPEPVKARRAKEMREATEETRAAFPRPDGRGGWRRCWSRRPASPSATRAAPPTTPPVIVGCGPEFCGRIVPVKITARAGERCIGQMLGPEEV